MFISKGIMANFELYKQDTKAWGILPGPGFPGWGPIWPGIGDTWN